MADSSSRHGRAAGSWLRARAFDWGFFPVLRRHDAFASADLEMMRESLLDSPYLADNPLNYRFSGSQGFSVVFRSTAIERVRTALPALGPFLSGVLDARCNAFFLNPLAISGSGRVEPHVDRSLRSFTSPDEPPNPRRVSVLYLSVPQGMRGGALVIYHRFIPLAVVRPRPNLLVEFQGFLRHEVTQVVLEDDAPASLPRLSLVCEQYVLSPSLLERIPEFTVHSGSDFEDFLEAELDLSQEDEEPGEPPFTWAEKVDRSELPPEVLQALEAERGAVGAEEAGAKSEAPLEESDDGQDGDAPAQSRQ